MSTVLGTNEILHPTEELLSPSGWYSAHLLDRKGQLMILNVRHGATAIWSSPENPDGDYFAIMQGDGNLCIYPGTSMDDLKGPAVWSTGQSFPEGGYYATLDDADILSVREPSTGRVIWMSNRPSLRTNEILRPNEYLLSPSGWYSAYLLDRKGQLMILNERHGATAIWSSPENPDGDYFAIMQGDGNLCIYPGTSMDDLKGPAVWSTGQSFPEGGYYATLGDDGILSVCEPSTGRVIWSTNRPFLRTNEILHTDEPLLSLSGKYYAYLHRTSILAVYDLHDGCPGHVWNSANAQQDEGDYFAIMQGDGNLCIYPGTSWDNRTGPAVWSTGQSFPNGEFFLWMQDDGNLAVYEGVSWQPEKCVWSIGYSVHTDFDLQKYAFKFPNDFTITCAQLGLPTSISAKLLGKKIRIDLPQWADGGFCGGMCAAALNRFNNGAAAETTTDTPAPGTPLYNELWDRQKRTLAGDVMVTMVDRTCSPDKSHDENPFHSMQCHAKREWDKLRPRLQGGKPTILVLIDTEVDANWRKWDFDFDVDLTKNHQVLAIGYREYWDPQGFIKICIYDPNDHDRVHVLRMVLSWKFIDCYDETTGKKHRGFFVNSQTDAAAK